VWDFSKWFGNGENDSCRFLENLSYENKCQEMPEEEDRRFCDLPIASGEEVMSPFSTQAYENPATP
jgi:hypothetical protein